MSAELIGKTIFLAVACPPDAKTALSTRPRKTVNQNRAKTLPREAVWPTKCKSER